MKNKKIFIPCLKPDDWQHLLANPKKQWKKGYSARSLAHCWQKANGLPRDVEDVLLQISEFQGIESLIMIPEQKVPLPGGPGPSQIDCWVLARTQSDLISIAVEGKVSEPFGPTIGKWITDASDGKKERLNYLCSLLGLDISCLMSIRYQLLHRTASAVIQARKYHANHAVMIIHSFSQTAKRFDHYKQFVTLFRATAETNKVISLGKISDINLYLAWVIGDELYLNK